MRFINQPKEVVTSTTEPPSAHSPEFGDSKRVRELFSIPRSSLYELANQGLIRGVTLRKRGKIRGKRLWDLDSIRSYLTSVMEEQQAEEQEGEEP